MGLNDKCLELTISYDVPFKLTDARNIQDTFLNLEPIDVYSYFIHNYNNIRPLLTESYITRFVVRIKHLLCHLLHRELR